MQPLWPIRFILRLGAEDEGGVWLEHDHELSNGDEELRGQGEEMWSGHVEELAGR